MVGPVPETWAIDPAGVRTFWLVPGLRQLRLPTPWDGLPATNAFVLERDDGGITLVDCGGSGDPSAYEALVAGLAAGGWALADIRQLVITHWHSDHAGTAARIVRETGCSVAGHPSAGHAFDAWERPGEVARARVELARRDGLPADVLPAFGLLDEELEGFDGPVVPDLLLTAGVHIDSTLGPWDVVETPGHAPSHLCLFQPEHRLLLAGDLIAPAFVPYFDIGHTPDPAGEFIASLKAVGELDVAVAYPGHGRAIEDVGRVVAEHLSAVEDCLAACALELERGGPGTVYDVLCRMHPSPMNLIALVWRWCETTAYLHHLWVRGIADIDDGPNDTIRYVARPRPAARRRTATG